MRTTFLSGLTTVAAVAAALSLAACDQRSASNAPPASATTDISQKMAAAGDKVVTAVDDSAVTAKVKAALMAEPGLRSLQIDVDTKNATVTLSGSVDTDASRDRAKQVASSVAGVSAVVDRLTVKS